MRLLFVAALLATLDIGDAVAADNGAKLLQIFEKTCAAKPVSGEALDGQARSFGYINQYGPVAPDDLKRDPDDVYSWKLPAQDSNFAISAYFGGPRAHYQVSCSIHADNVEAADFLARLRSETNLLDPQTTKSDAGTGALTYSWTAEADGGKDVLQVRTFRDGRVSLAFTYDVIAR
jgi:hypothetical protein